MTGKTHDASDEQQVKKLEDTEKDKERDLEWVLSSPRGRRLMYDIIHDTCHVRLRSHVPGQNDTTAFNDGARCVGESILEAIRSKHFDKYLLMMKENHGDI